MPSSSKPRIITWLILIMIVLYILYSSNFLLLSRSKKDCSNSIRLEASFQEQPQTTGNNMSLTTNTVERESDEDEKPGEENNEKEDEDEEGKANSQNVVGEEIPYDELSQRQDTNVEHIVFGIAASSNLWETRKEYIKVWWKPNKTRGVVWLDSKVKVDANEGLPQLRISGDTSKLKYTNSQGQRSALRISRVVTETLKLGMKNVRWFMMGDDDTVFVVDNVVRVLSKYDHTQFYYVGSSSESHVQNIHFSYAMAYGGGGFAISYPLAKELANMQDRCIQRYPALYGSDDRMQACMAELGVPMTREQGFHQYDVYGDLLGLLGAHPKAFLFYMNTTRYDPVKKTIFGTYSRFKTRPPECSWQMQSPEIIDSIIVSKKPDPLRWQRALCIRGVFGTTGTNRGSVELPLLLGVSGKPPALSGYAAPPFLQEFLENRQN
ncbi:uncharacterized protein HKW66_Vig0118240 [Vigna angularis]|uniref:Uncharacterized protein n=1 Tax=Phaseolus angularis TaxID=3914 RepID=A0A8T0JVQ0_PHAAN|nr:uncharacterized protein HKW66_Vig0118240 [Vigna angularis]